MWQVFLNRVEYLERAEFKIKKGHFLNETRDDYETVMLFDGVARMKSGKLTTIKAVQTVRWKKQPSTGKDEASLWHIYDWRTENLKTIEADQKLFVEVSQSALIDAQARARARDSIHERYVIQYLLDKKNFKRPHEDFSLSARGVALNVVDLDRDGFDDLYAIDQWGENLFLHNRGDGTFEEIATDLGLNFKHHTTSAIFGDFDNDGDADLFLGRFAARSLYLVNENGRFVDRSEELVDGSLPYFVLSISAVDYNRDGLLDIYMSTGGAPGGIGGGKVGEALTKVFNRKNDKLLENYLTEADAKRLYRLRNSDEANFYMNRFGPPSVLRKNIGDGRFEIPKESPELRIFRMTLQSSWSDFDGDGDPDVYLANDFGPNYMFRNDGNGKFVDVTEQTNTVDTGFGMGISWGDYDNDGMQDLYVTNMYSKAGRRITAQIPGLNPIIAQTSRGNSLFHNVSGRFDKVSGMAPPDLGERGV